LIRIRRDGMASTRYAAARVGLFFLAAGLWLAGVIADQQVITGAAIIVAALALFVGLLARRGQHRDEVDGADEEAGGEADPDGNDPDPLGDDPSDR